MEFEDEFNTQDLVTLKYDEEMIRVQEDDMTKKHAQEKQQHSFQLNSQRNFQQMKYFLDCGFNLLIYGNGSKRNLINNFITTYIDSDPCLIINGFHSATTIKSLTTPLAKFVNKHF